MGQKKTWALHHVPFSMLWEPAAHDYAFYWSSTLQAQLIEKYTTTIPDFYFSKTSFFTIWNSSFLNLKQTNFKNNKLNKKKKATLQYFFNENANKGSNETSASKSYLIKTTNTVTILHCFFRPLFLEQKKQLQYNKAKKNNDMSVFYKQYNVYKKSQKNFERKWPQNSTTYLKALKVSLARSTNLLFTPQTQKINQKQFALIKKKQAKQNRQLHKILSTTKQRDKKQLYKKIQNVFRNTYSQH